MALEILFSNNAVSTLLAGITNAATALSVQAGKGALFAAPGANQIQKITLFKTDLSAVEVIHLVTRSGDTFSVVVRGQEGTTAVAWNAGDGVMDSATAAVFTGLSQLDRTETFTAKKTFSAGAAINGITEFGNGIGPGYLNNIGFASSVAANALTNALKGQDGADPSATNPVEVAFRSTTLATALPVVRKLTAAMSVVAPQGATLGFVINTIGTFTVTIASPAVVTLTNHGLVDGQMVRLATTGALPTGLAVLTDYFVKYLSTSTFNLAATLGGANINTSGSQSGVHTLTSGEVGYVYKYLVDDGATRALAICKQAVFDEALLHNTVAIGTGSDSNNVLYATAALSNCAVRLIGRELIQTGMAAVGDWPNAPTRREVWGPAMDKNTSVAAGFTRVTPNLCYLNTGSTPSLITGIRDTYVEIPSPSPNSKALIVWISARVGSANAIGARNTFAIIATNSAGTTVPYSGGYYMDVRAYEHSAVAAGTLLNRQDVFNTYITPVPGASLWISLQDDSGNQGTLYAAVVGYYD